MHQTTGHRSSGACAVWAAAAMHQTTGHLSSGACVRVSCRRGLGGAENVRADLLEHGLQPQGMHEQLSELGAKVKSTKASPGTSEGGSDGVGMGHGIACQKGWEAA